MKVYPPLTYTPVVRVEIKVLSTGEMRSVSFCKTTLDEVIDHVNKTLKTGIVGIKVRVNIRISDQVKRWGKQKIATVLINDLDEAFTQITEGIETLDWKVIKG
ncbi:hypothetical protein IR083_07770 [Dysgonomonas sp. GY75]|uniref:hypothetical protein n=1 Tax=Dysgonomonas sp. GY75 TaxID=2780419 RepID=UPI0018835EF4|nr:hypothetical protein [Dysgonomonas sp. GY75]MBF0648715.1 hypothetical protein [Dysgonomonas sp. GY75]